MIKNKRKAVFILVSYLLACIAIIFAVVLSSKQKVFIISIMSIFLFIEIFMYVSEEKQNNSKRKVITNYQLLMSFLFIYVGFGVMLSNNLGFFDETILFGWQEALYSIPPCIALFCFIVSITKNKN
jgi:1,4-dihydroxy-2-naphthoate octaprenyltransferase